jgi:hypothetical protein
MNPVNEVEGGSLKIRAWNTHCTRFEVLVFFLRKVVSVNPTTNAIRPFKNANTVAMGLE